MASSQQVLVNLFTSRKMDVMKLFIKHNITSRTFDWSYPVKRTDKEGNEYILYTLGKLPLVLIEDIRDMFCISVAYEDDKGIMQPRKESDLKGIKGNAITAALRIMFTA